jgi:carbon storage regulator
MLVLSRKLSQRIMIGPDVSITIVKIDRNTVRIGIEAPGHLEILRDELIEGMHDRVGVATAGAQRIATQAV